jgi:hypothetical protein
LVRSGGEQMERHGIDLSYDFSGEIAMLVAAFGSILAGLMCVAKIGIEERVRSRWNGDGMVRFLQHPLFRLLIPQKEHHIIPPMKLVYTLSYAAASTAFVALTSTFASAIYTRLHQLTIRQTTCHFEMGEQNDAQFKCTPELAVCEISPYLLKHDISEYARARRQEACGQLVCFQSSLLSSRIRLTSHTAILSPNAPSIIVLVILPSAWVLCPSLSSAQIGEGKRVYRRPENCVGAIEFGLAWAQSEWELQDREGRIRYPVYFRNLLCTFPSSSIFIY